MKAVLLLPWLAPYAMDLSGKRKPTGPNFQRPTINTVKLPVELQYPKEFFPSVSFCRVITSS